MRVFFLLIAFVITFSSTAQDEYTVLVDDEKVVISYQVLEVKKKGALIPEIKLTIKNKTDGYVQVSFEMNLRYDMEFAEATNVSKICVKPGKTLKGKIKGMYYNPESLTIAQLQSDDFEIYLDDLKVVSVAKCK